MSVIWFASGLVLGALLAFYQGMKYARKNGSTWPRRAKGTGYWKISVDVDGTCNLIRQAPERRQWIEFPQREVEEMHRVALSIRKRSE